MIEFAQRSLIATTVLLGAVAAPARADMTSDVQLKVDAAMKSAKSFVVTTLYPAQAYSATLVHVAPDRSRVVVAVAATTTDIVTVGGTSYSSKNGAPFEKAALSADASARVHTFGDVKVGAIDADVTIDGVTYGAFETTFPLGADITLRCTYEKKSFRLVRCANGDVTQTYSGYNDPQNVVEPPTNVVDAPAGAH
jgi:hypothetical protein